MREFFKPWRRKIGVVTLVVACVAMAGWVRSYIVVDRIRPAIGMIYVYSWSGSIFLDTAHGDFFCFPEWSTRTVSETDGLFQYVIEWHWKCVGFGCIKHMAGSAEWPHQNVVIPYWSIVLPLTALSGFLLLPKPRQSTQKKTPEPNANEGGGAAS